MVSHSLHHKVKSTQYTIGAYAWSDLDYILGSISHHNDKGMTLSLITVQVTNLTVCLLFFDQTAFLCLEHRVPICSQNIFQDLVSWSRS